MTKYALISVSDKSGIETLAMELEALGYTIVSTSRTAKHLKQFCHSLVQVSDLTGFPEILDGRVKNLHPRFMAQFWPTAATALTIHFGSTPDRLIDIVVVNLYPFHAVRHEQTSTHREIIENIDIAAPL
jgi:phosphoribosylaminoimidazolecarboxamide formyltransferase/IMP cyclohydrolase